MLANFECVRKVLAAPGGSELSGGVNFCWEASHGREYSSIGEKPVLIDFAESVIDRDWLFLTSAGSAVARRKGTSLVRRVFNACGTSEAATRRNLDHLLVELDGLARRPLVLVVGGGSIGRGVNGIYDDREIDVVAFDIYDSPNVQVIADAHKLPFRTGVFDAVIVQAVLEHVIEPLVCVKEIERVLAADGLVYAETPFMQQVHEGPFDFTRYTESGHRFLFRGFDRLNSGSIGGPGTQFIWSVDYLTRSLFQSPRAGKLAKLACCWVQLLDRLIPESYCIDGASGVFFLGRKSDKVVSPKSMVSHYRGAQGV